MYTSGQQIVTSLVGTELVTVDTGGAVFAAASVSQIAALSSQFENDSPTNVTSAVGTTYAASALLTGLLNRSGPTANYTDTTPTAAQIVAAGGYTTFPVSFYIDIKNTVPFLQTLQGGTGVTISSSPVTPGNSIAEWLVVINSATSVTFNHIFTAQLTDTTLEIITALSTVGAGTLVGAAIAGGIVSRTGSQSNTAFTDTTDTAANIIAAQPNAHIGASWEFSYQNTTNATATIGGGTGVTVSGVTAVPAGASARFLVTYTAANTVTVVGFMISHPSIVSGTFTANGVSSVTVTNSNITANSVVAFGLKTVGGTPAGAPFMATVTPGTGFTVKAVAGDTSVYNYLIIN